MSKFVKSATNNAGSWTDILIWPNFGVLGTFYDNPGGISLCNVRRGLIRSPQARNTVHLLISGLATANANIYMYASDRLPLPPALDMTAR